MIIEDYIKGFEKFFGLFSYKNPWEFTANASFIVTELLNSLGEDFIVNDGVAIHKSATVEDRAILKAPVIISTGCFIGHHAYLRNGVYLGENSSVGPACEIKSSIIMNHTEIAHLNFVGNSIFGSHINFEAGAIAANYYNEREVKEISVLVDNTIIRTDAKKFGSLVGDNCRVGANAVLSPGTILKPFTVVRRLELVEQIRY